MLDRADRLLRELLDSLGPALERGAPIVGLEPACVSAFRDEVPALYPHDDRAQRLQKQSVSFGEFLDRNSGEIELPKSSSTKALVQVHCHEHAVLNPSAEAEVLKRLDVAAEIMPSGCCGMAGSFGFESGKYLVSRKIAEHALLPRLRSAAPEAVVVANGFSCREQIEQLTGRPTRHIAEMAASALGFPPTTMPPASRSRQLATIAVAGVIGVGFLFTAWKARRRLAQLRNRATGPRGSADRRSQIAAANPANAAAPAATRFR
jgi:Fe-S oxidoreductase